MTTLRASFTASVLLAFGLGCAASEEHDFGSSVSRKEANDLALDVDANSDEGEAIDEDSDEDVVDPDADDADEGADETTAAWDAAPPEAADGVTVEGKVTCGLALAEFTIAWQFTDGQWAQVAPPGAPFQPRPELAGCLEVSPKSFQWSDDGAIHWESGGWDHDLLPTETEGRWFGTAEPMQGPSAECQAAIEDAGLTLPFPLVLEITAIEG